MPTNMPLEQLDSNWLTQMRKWQEEFVGSLSAREFVDGVTAEVLGQSVFVYTHTGELRRLPKVGGGVQEGRGLLGGWAAVVGGWVVHTLTVSMENGLGCRACACTLK
jgi:hypothetical protein